MNNQRDESVSCKAEGGSLNVQEEYLGVGLNVTVETTSRTPKKTPAPRPRMLVARRRRVYKSTSPKKQLQLGDATAVSPQQHSVKGKFKSVNNKVQLDNDGSENPLDSTSVDLTPKKKVRKARKCKVEKVKLPRKRNNLKSADVESIKSEDPSDPPSPINELSGDTSTNAMLSQYSDNSLNQNCTELLDYFMQKHYETKVGRLLGRANPEDGEEQDVKPAAMLTQQLCNSLRDNAKANKKQLEQACGVMKTVVGRRARTPMMSKQKESTDNRLLMKIKPTKTGTDNVRINKKEKSLKTKKNIKNANANVSCTSAESKKNVFECSADQEYFVTQDSADNKKSTSEVNYTRKRSRHSDREYALENRKSTVTNVVSPTIKPNDSNSSYIGQKLKIRRIRGSPPKTTQLMSRREHKSQNTNKNTTSKAEINVNNSDYNIIMTYKVLNKVCKVKVSPQDLKLLNLDRSQVSADNIISHPKLIKPKVRLEDTLYVPVSAKDQENCASLVKKLTHAPTEHQENCASGPRSISKESLDVVQQEDVKINQVQVLGPQKQKSVILVDSGSANGISTSRPEANTLQVVNHGKMRIPSVRGRPRKAHGSKRIQRRDRLTSKAFVCPTCDHSENYTTLLIRHIALYHPDAIRAAREAVAPKMLAYDTLWDDLPEFTCSTKWPANYGPGNIQNHIDTSNKILIEKNRPRKVSDKIGTKNSTAKVNIGKNRLKQIKDTVSNLGDNVTSQHNQLIKVPDNIDTPKIINDVPVVKNRPGKVQDNVKISNLVNNIPLKNDRPKKVLTNTLKTIGSNRANRLNKGQQKIDTSKMVFEVHVKRNRTKLQHNIAQSNIGNDVLIDKKVEADQQLSMPVPNSVLSETTANNAANNNKSGSSVVLPIEKVQPSVIPVPDVTKHAPVSVADSRCENVNNSLNPLDIVITPEKYSGLLSDALLTDNDPMLAEDKNSVLQTSLNEYFDGVLELNTTSTSAISTPNTSNNSISNVNKSAIAVHITAKDSNQHNNVAILKENSDRISFHSTPKASHSSSVKTPGNDVDNSFSENPQLHDYNDDSQLQPSGYQGNYSTMESDAHNNVNCPMQNHAHNSQTSLQHDLYYQFNRLKMQRNISYQSCRCQPVKGNNRIKFNRVQRESIKISKQTSPLPMFINNLHNDQHHIPLETCTARTLSEHLNGYCDCGQRLDQINYYKARQLSSTQNIANYRSSQASSQSISSYGVSQLSTRRIAFYRTSHSTSSQVIPLYDATQSSSQDSDAYHPHQSSSQYIDSYHANQIPGQSSSQKIGYYQPSQTLSQGIDFYQPSPYSSQGIDHQPSQSSSQGIDPYQPSPYSSQGIDPYQPNQSSSQGIDSYQPSQSSSQGIDSYQPSPYSSQGIDPYQPSQSSSQGYGSYQPSQSSSQGHGSYQANQTSSLDGCYEASQSPREGDDNDNVNRYSLPPGKHNSLG